MLTINLTLENRTDFGDPTTFGELRRFVALTATHADTDPVGLAYAEDASSPDDHTEIIGLYGLTDD